MSRYGYPFIECGEHPGPQLGRVICSHVRDGAFPDCVEAPTKENLGIAMCLECYNRGKEYWIDRHDELDVICEQHYMRRVVQ